MPIKNAFTSATIARQAALLLLLFLLATRSSAQLIWAGAIQSYLSTATCYSVTADPQDNVISAGLFNETIDMDPGAATVMVTSVGEYDGYVQKLSPSGTFIWGIRIGGTAMDRIMDVCTDPDGNVLVTGRFEGTADFDPGPDESMLIAVEGEDAFVAKYSASGTFLWARAIGGTNDQRGYALDVDAAGNVFATGAFRGGVDLDPGPNEQAATTEGQEDVYIIKLDAQGSLVWAMNFGASSGDEGRALDVDDDGNVVVTGTFRFTVDFDPGVNEAIIESEGYDCFILKLNGAGEFLWARNIGGYDTDLQHTVSIDPAGNIYAASTFDDVDDLDPGPDVELHGVEGQVRLFVIKLDAAGEMVWVKDQEVVYQLEYLSSAVDADGRLYLCGSGVGSFIRYLDGNGNILSTPTTTSRDDQAIALDAVGNILIGGVYTNATDVDPGPGQYFLEPEGSYNAFVVKWGPGLVAVPEQHALLDLQVYPVPFRDRLTITTGHRSALLTKVFAADGRLLTERTLNGTLVMDLSTFPTGMYALEIWSTGSRLDRRILIKTR